MWVSLLKGLFFLFLSILLAPKPPTPKPGEALEGVPRSEEGEPIPFVYGTVWVRSPQVPWYGDFSSEAIEGGGKK